MIDYARVSTTTNRDDDRNSDDGIYISPLELTLLFFQSLLVGATTAFSAKYIFDDFAPMIPRILATAGGLFLGLLVSYPSIRVFARAGGYRLGFFKWFVICIGNALFVMIVLSVL